MGIFAQQQIKHLKGWGLGKKSGDDFIERTKNNLPSLWDGELAESYCAKGDGTSGYMLADTPVTGYPFTYAVKMIPVSNLGVEAILDLAKSTVSSTNFNILRSSQKLYMIVRHDGTTYISDNDFTDGDIFASGVPITIIVEFLNTTTVNVYVDDLLTTYNPTFSVSPLPSVDVDRFGLMAQSDSTPGTFGPDKILWSGQFNRALTTAEKTALMADDLDSMSFVPATDSFYVHNGSLLDIVSTRNLTVTGTVDIFETQRFFHYNIMKGFDDYTDDATELIHIYVPYVDGEPVVASIADYTKQTTNPAGTYHNSAETKVVPFTSSHDGTGWVVPADIKAIDTDEILHNSSTGYAIPLDYDDLATLDGANSAYVFVDISAYISDSTKGYKNLMLYTEELTGVELIKARAFVNH